MSTDSFFTAYQRGFKEGYRQAREKYQREIRRIIEFQGVCDGQSTNTRKKSEEEVA